jgi:ABC-type glycerol-3-phosphate transport system substrate-binding protein
VTSSIQSRTLFLVNIDGAQIFLGKDGVMSVPFLVDPLVVYYNKDILASSLYAAPPKTWNDLAGGIARFTKRTEQNTITQSAIALGETQNVDHARDILSALFLQVGNPIVSYDRTTGVSRAVLNQGAANENNLFPTTEVVNFFNSFSNPTSSAYSWNKSLPPSRDAFVAGRLAFYIGRASELFVIQAQNPNLSFDVIELFQAADAPRPITFGSFIGASILSRAKNMPAAYAFVATLSADTKAVDQLSKLYNLPPTRRDLLLVPQENPYVAVFFRAALSSFAWPDPNFIQTEAAFRAMIQNSTSGRSETDAAINEANATIQSYIR